MSDSFTLGDVASLDDLRVFLGRAARIEDGSVRLIAGSGVLAVYVAVLYPAGLLDETPTVLALRTFALVTPEGDETDAFDVVVPIASLASRLERARDGIGDIVSPVEPAATRRVTISLPMSVAS